MYDKIKKLRKSKTKKVGINISLAAKSNNRKEIPVEDANFSNELQPLIKC